MNRSLILLSLAAGLAGGALTRYLTPIPVQAQTPQAPAAAQTVTAQTLKLPLELVNQTGAVVGAFTMDSDGKPNIRLYDPAPRSKAEPHVIWSARGATLQPAVQR
ncbi:MAG TPA: hypothetical protein VGN17_00835 [Bryobacteraceae bacterium]|jgi:hypothetical protein